MAERLASVVTPLATLRVPVKLAAEEMVCELTNPEVIAPRVALPVLRAVANRLVEEAVVEKIEVVVALVEVELRKVMF